MSDATPSTGTPARESRGLVRSTRVGAAVTLGVDGRIHEPDDPLSGLVGGSAEETAEAASIVEEAQHRADDLVRTAMRQAGAVEERARNEGYERGLAEGRAEGRAELAEALALVQRVALQGKAIRDELFARSEREMVEIVIAAFRAVIGDRITTDPGVVNETVRRALDRAGSQNIVRIRVHPDAVDGLSAHLTEEYRGAPPFEVSADGAIGVGGCVVETDFGHVDARLDVQMDEIARILRESLPELPGSSTGMEAHGDTRAA
ncbi:MAG: FliH/SctL family protein [Dehalococcoidia bacterium]|nr:FliH/SctL family protein [Dehalococcoidia bacterium]